MGQYPRFAIAPSNRYPTVSTAVPSQYPVIELVDAEGEVVTNIGDGPADGDWINMTLANGFTAGDVTPMYMKDSRNVVHLRGKVVCPGGQVVAWVPPAGYAANIAAGSTNYFDFLNGGSDLLNPSRFASISAGGLAAGQTSAGAPGAEGAVCALDRIHWQA